MSKRIKGTAATRKVEPPNSRGVSSEDAEIGRRIRLFRIERDISQEALGERLGVSFQQVQKYEKASTGFRRAG
jgi:DNA-binding transcriptional regulator YiaG